MVWFKRVNSELLHRETREQHTVVVYHEVTLVAIGHISVYLVTVAVRSDLIAELQRTSPRHFVEEGLYKVVDDIFLGGADIEGEVSHLHHSFLHFVFCDLMVNDTPRLSFIQQARAL